MILKNEDEDKRNEDDNMNKNYIRDDLKAKSFPYKHITNSLFTYLSHVYKQYHQKSR